MEISLKQKASVCGLCIDRERTKALTDAIIKISQEEVIVHMCKKVIK